MSLFDKILALRRPKIWQRFRGLREQPAPETESVTEAWHMGLQTGFGEGLVEGVDLGIDVGMASPVVAQTDACEWIEN